MTSTNDRRPEAAADRPPAATQGVTTAARGTPHSPPAPDGPPHQEAHDAPTHATPPEVKPPSNRWRKWALLGAGVGGLVVAAYFLIPWVDTALHTISTDDAYVNSHVTF